MEFNRVIATDFTLKIFFCQKNVFEGKVSYGHTNLFCVYNVFEKKMLAV